MKKQKKLLIRNTPHACLFDYLHIFNTESNYMIHLEAIKKKNDFKFLIFF